jgi:hypothetical protein
MRLSFYIGLCVVIIVTNLLSVTQAVDTRFVFSELTVKDKKTGLIWTRKANLFGKDLIWTETNMKNKANVWYKTLNRSKYWWSEAQELVKIMNETNYAGYSDWYIPSKKEMESLLNYARVVGYYGKIGEKSPYILFNQMGFYDVQAGFYWTSSKGVNVRDLEAQWAVDMRSGYFADDFHGNNYCYIWPVRSGK